MDYCALLGMVSSFLLVLAKYWNLSFSLFRLCPPYNPPWCVGTIDSGCHPDICSHHAAYFVALCIFCSFMYTSCMMFVLKYGSCSILFMAQTILVPIGNLTFSLPFMPQA